MEKRKEKINGKGIHRSCYQGNGTPHCPRTENRRHGRVVFRGVRKMNGNRFLAAGRRLVYQNGHRKRRNALRSVKSEEGGYE